MVLIAILQLHELPGRYGERATLLVDSKPDFAGICEKQSELIVIRAGRIGDQGKECLP